MRSENLLWAQFLRFKADGGWRTCWWTYLPSPPVHACLSAHPSIPSTWQLLDRPLNYPTHLTNNHLPVHPLFAKTLDFQKQRFSSKYCYSILQASNIALTYIGKDNSSYYFTNLILHSKCYTLSPIP